jgi:PEP-CTERM motif
LLAFEKGITMSKLMSVRQLAVAAALSLGFAGATQAFTVAQGSAVAGTTTVSFKMGASGTGLFTLELLDSLGALVAPTGVTLTVLPTTPSASFSVVSAPGGTSGAVSAIYSMTAGEFGLSFTSSFTGGSFSVKASNNLSGTLSPLSINSPVPEPESVALVLAGLGVAGMLSRRRLGHGHAVPTYTA